jgi:hypothetical protein
MRIYLLNTLLITALITGLTLGAFAAPGPKGPKDKPGGGHGKPLKIKHLNQGDLYCPTAVLVYGNVVIQSGRCYTLFVMRDPYGTYLAFGQPGIPPGQLVRLNTPAGAKVRGRIFYLVPIQATAVLVPVNTITLVAVRAEDYGPQVSVVLVGVPAPNVTVVFNVRL